jgi:hypothetical protein
LFVSPDRFFIHQRRIEIEILPDQVFRVTGDDPDLSNWVLPLVKARYSGKVIQVS